MKNDNSTWQKVSFSEYLNDNGKVVKFQGSKIDGKVHFFYTLPLNGVKLNIAQVSSTDGTMYIVPFKSLNFLYAIS